jgi:hypothetical protein
LLLLQGALLAHLFLIPQGLKALLFSTRFLLFESIQPWASQHQA